ncbi:MAG: hypothetical protein HYR66_00925 [Sphingobacteriales bacterium]|nr:hypothetical protein [Sphingobacteriales bacterium]
MSEEKKQEEQAKRNEQQAKDENISSGETIADAEQPETNNQQQATEDMEVHKHPHHVMHTKKWSEYLLEFFMLFIAVFLGFIAENIREHIVEREKERQYMKSLLSDLSADTAMFTKGIQRKEQRINAIDSVFMFFKAHTDVTTISGKFFKTIRRTTWDQLLIRNTITINQLKNAGAMRLIKNKPVTDSLSAYDFQCESFGQYNTGYLTHQEVLYRYIEKMVDAPGLLDLYIANTSEAIVGNVPDTIALQFHNTEENQLLNLLMQIKIFARQEINRFENGKNTAKNLIALIKKEYYLD